MRFVQPFSIFILCRIIFFVIQLILKQLFKTKIKSKLSFLYIVPSSFLLGLSIFWLFSCLFFLLGFFVALFVLDIDSEFQSFNGSCLLNIFYPLLSIFFDPILILLNAGHESVFVGFLFVVKNV